MVRGRKARPQSATRLVSVVAALCRAITVVHGGGVDAAVLAIVSLPARTTATAMIGRTAPRRRLFLPPPPEECPGPAFIGFLLLRFPASVMKGYRSRLPFRLGGSTPPSRSLFDARKTPMRLEKQS